ncbi:MAG: serine protein kinase [Candidatus Nanoarchaeia archaeon]|nr:serine protein kinase [Candidatus Nanoarchaeia archaeon]
MGEEKDSGLVLFDNLGASSADVFNRLHEEMKLWDYLQKLLTDARPARTSYQRLYDMILSAGFEDVSGAYDDYRRYKFFTPFDPETGHPTENAIFGLEKPLAALVNTIKGAARELSAEKRLLLLHGPVGSAKSTIATLMKRGLEQYSKLEPLYSFRWINMEGKNYGGEKLHDMHCEMREDPLKLVLPEDMHKILQTINDNNVRNADSPMKYRIKNKGQLCPKCSFNLEHLMKEYKGDWRKAMENHVEVYRLLISEKDRKGIATFQPKDEKNQDSTELTGDINYKKIAEYGSDSDPRAFNFDGEFCVANRGMIEFIEVLKLDVAFLYDLLGATQEKTIKPKKFAQTDIDTVLIGHTNEAEFNKLKSNEFMAALRDRTIRIDIPYNVRLKEEIKVYEKLFSAESIGKHIAPHTLEVAAIWAILTRLEQPQNMQLTLLQKAFLYDGRTVKDFEPSKVKDMMKAAVSEGLRGVSPRFIQNIVTAASCSHDENCVDPYMVLNAAKKWLATSALYKPEDAKEFGGALLGLATNALETLIKEDMGKAICGDEEALDSMFKKYYDNVEASVNGRKIRSGIGREIEPDEPFMRSIEEKIGILDSAREKWRSTMIISSAGYARRQEPFTYKSNDQLRKALEDKLFDDNRDKISFIQYASGNFDKLSEEKKTKFHENLIKIGYCPHCIKTATANAQSIFGKEPGKE